MNDFTTDSPYQNDSSISSEKNTSSSPCLSSSSNYAFSPVSDILKIYPSVFKDALITFDIENCKIKNGYCSKSIDSESGCSFNTKDNTDSKCSCDCLLFPLNLMNSLNNTIYCILTNSSNTNFVFSEQVIVFSLDEKGGNISNANLTTSQTTDVTCISLSSSKVQEHIGDISYQVIQNIIQQSKTEPSLFKCPINQEFLNMYENYGDDDLNNVVQSSVVSTISSFIQESQTINISLSQVDFQKLSGTISQEDALKILTKNIVTQSFNKINTSVLGQQFDDIMSSFQNYCFPPDTTFPDVEDDQEPKIEYNPPSFTMTKNIWVIIIGGFCLIAIIAGIFLCYFRKRESNKTLSINENL